MFDNLIGLLAELPTGVLAVIAAELDVMPAGTSFSKLVGMRPNPDILIGGAMSELHLAGTLAEALGYRLYQILILIGSA